MSNTSDYEVESDTLNVWLIAILFLLGGFGCLYAVFSEPVEHKDPYLEFCVYHGYETYAEVKIAEYSWQQVCLHPDKPSRLIYRGKNGHWYLEN